MAALSAAALLPACGGDGTPSAPTTIPPGVDQVVDVEMLDIRFDVEELEVEAGSTVAFRFRNRGRVVHEAFVAGPEGESPTDEGVELRPGRSGLFVHTFGEAGRVVIGCYEPGHFSAGMKIAVTVV